jgi:hypothetical protein
VLGLVQRAVCNERIDDVDETSLVGVGRVGYLLEDLGEGAFGGGVRFDEVLLFLLRAWESAGTLLRS